MPDCEKLKACRFFKRLAQLPKTAEYYATVFCKTDNRGCARLAVLSKGVQPPDDLFPNETHRIQNCCQSGSKIV